MHSLQVRLYFHNNNPHHHHHLDGLHYYANWLLRANYLDSFIIDSFDLSPKIPLKRGKEKNWVTLITVSFFEDTLCTNGLLVT